jgi:hypothetical protein
VRPGRLDRLAGALTDAIDPTAPNPYVVTRVLDTLEGIDSLAPPQACPDLDLSLWRFLRDEAGDFLLPGVEQLPDDAVTAVQTNPTFVDAFLTGANTQALAELRWRNIPIASGCTPLRSFWDRLNPLLATRERDIRPIAEWPSTSDLGAPAHQTPSGSPSDLVLVCKSALFQRYPQTLVYFVPAVTGANGDPDWETDPDFATATPTFPQFQGSIGDEITFFSFDLSPADARGRWVVFEEPPPGYRFRNTPAASWPASRVAAFQTATTGAAFADAAFSDPTRVLIRGTAIVLEV